MRFLKILILVVIIGFLGWGLFNLEKQSRRLEIKLNKLKTNSEALGKERQNLEENIEYLKHFENLVKELKSLFNYRQPEEKLMIIIPNKKNESR